MALPEMYGSSRIYAGRMAGDIYRDISDVSVASGYPILTCEFAIGRGSGKSVGSALKELAPKGGNWHKFESWYAYADNYLLMMFLYYGSRAGWYTMCASWDQDSFMVVSRSNRRQIYRDACITGTYGRDPHLRSSCVV